MVYVVSHSWHLPYAMKPWINYANEGFDGGFNTKSYYSGLDYMHVGKHYDDGGG